MNKNDGPTIKLPMWELVAILVLSWLAGFILGMFLVAV